MPPLFKDFTTVPHDIALYHAAHCSKSREALKLLEVPPDKDTLNSIIKMLSIKEPRDLIHQHKKYWILPYETIKHNK